MITCLIVKNANPACHHSGMQSGYRPFVAWSLKCTRTTNKGRFAQLIPDKNNKRGSCELTQTKELLFIIHKSHYWLYYGPATRINMLV
ncbi:hypothetical protein L6452_36877 [Arctium lappa]|uniref:Uncharacterized protein n=1 Tax=Arctium lappa TaxID=4217 RepID=A0ACB8Y247_ARCLA|nr:hypothetical protein L6452_36877 [Arctium lappa]